MFEWDPNVYRHFDDDRSRPFYDLLARVDVEAPATVVDLGCGPGHLTSVLQSRWPDAAVIGTDNSESMLAAAAAPGVRFVQQDVRDWRPTPDVGVAMCNAVLQWVPSHLPLLRTWASALARGSCLAWQVPANFGSPSHLLMRSVAAAFPELSGVLRHDGQPTAADYTTLLLDAGLRADVWETTYQHVLTGDDPVLRWVQGTGLRPVLAALEDPTPFVDEYAARLRSAYPQRPDGTTVFAFRRVFAVGRKP